MASSRNLLTRSTFIILGLVILMGAGLFFFIDRQNRGGGGGMTIIPVPV